MEEICVESDFQSVPQLGLVGSWCKQFFGALALFYNIIIEKNHFLHYYFYMAHRKQPNLLAGGVPAVSLEMVL